MKNIIMRPLRIFEKTIYTVRDAFWVYPDSFLTDNPSRREIVRTYQHYAPFSHMATALLSIGSVALILFTTGLPQVFGARSNRLIEGVVMGTNTDGAVQSLSHINPLLPSNIQLEKDLVQLIYEPLFRYTFSEDGTSQGTLDLQLAEEVITIKPGSDYQISLRKGVKWHDSADNPTSQQYEIFSADDVLRTFSVLSQVDETLPNSSANAFTRALKQLQWEKIDDYTVRICTKPLDADALTCDDRQNNPIFSNFLELISFNIIPDHHSADINSQNINTAQPELYRTPVGTGPFTIQSIGSSAVTVKLFEDHYEQFAPDIVNALQESLLRSLRNDIFVDANESTFDEVQEQSQEEIASLRAEQTQFDTKYTVRIASLTPFSATDQNQEVSQETVEGIPVRTVGRIAGMDIEIDWDITIEKRDSAITEVSFAFFTTLEQAFTALTNGEIHTIGSLSTEFDTEIINLEHLVKNAGPVLYNQFWGLYFNLRKTPNGEAIGSPALLDMDVRRAISLLLNREILIQDALGGLGTEATGPIPSPSPFYVNDFNWDESNELVEENLRINPAVTPETLLDSAGWQIDPATSLRTNGAGETLSFSLYFVENYDRRQLVERIKSQLAEYGITVIIEKSEQPLGRTQTDSDGWQLSELNDQVLAPRLFDVLLYGMNTFVDPDRYELYHSSQATHPGLNLPGYEGARTRSTINRDREENEADIIREPLVDIELERARSINPVTALEERKNAYSDVQKEIAREVPVIYLYHPQFVYYANKQVRDVQFSASSFGLEDRFRNIASWGLEN